MDEILDSGLIIRRKEVIFNALKWWEGKRLIFNLLVISCEIFMMLFFWQGTQIFGIDYAIIESIAYTFVANVFFSTGWGLEILVLYYFGENRFLRNLRIPFFILGILFSIILTSFLYRQCLSFYQAPYFFN